MAFVFRTNRQLNSAANDSSPLLGPGSYIQHRQYQFSKSTAPFNTQVSRNHSKKDQDTYPGPGYYNIETQSDGQKVVLQSGSSEVKILEVPKPQCNFKSNTKRFIQQKIHDTPGPGSYNYQHSLEKGHFGGYKDNNSSIIEHLMKINRYQSIPSIPSQNQVFGYQEKENNELELNKNPLDVHSGVKSDTVGPGQYNLKNMTDQIGKKGPTWSKSKVPKLAPTVPKEQELMVGPGHYDYDTQLIPLYKLRPSCNFASRSMRDSKKGQASQQFIMQRLQKSQKNFIGKLDDNETEEIEFVDDRTPGPGQYFQSSNSTGSSSSMLRYKQDLPSAFGSQSIRFKESINSVNVGPGDYELTKQASFTSSLAYKSPPFQSSNSRFENRAFEMKPGPQTYNTAMTLEEKLAKKIQRGPLGNFGSNVKRFKESKDELPGPGTYNELKSEEVDDALAQIQTVFKSKTNRDAFQVKKEIIPPPGAYNIDHYTIQKSTKVEKEEDPDLAVKKPPFNTGLPRFKEFKQKAIEEEDEEQKYEEKPVNELFMKKPNKGAAFQAKSERFKYNNAKDSSNPAPGDYHDSKSNPWVKRTYNILFAEI